jgi:WhiB family redox-sensing transcriptional regulator
MSNHAPNWLTAACRDQDPELFFPTGTGILARRQAGRAKAVCARCVLCEACLDWALASGIAEGVWGAHTEQERRALRARSWPARGARPHKL